MFKIYKGNFQNLKKKIIAKSVKSCPLEINIVYKSFIRLRKEKRQRQKILSTRKRKKGGDNRTCGHLNDESHHRHHVQGESLENDTWRNRMIGEFCTSKGS